MSPPQIDSFPLVRAVGSDPPAWEKTAACTKRGGQMPAAWFATNPTLRAIVLQLHDADVRAIEEATVRGAGNLSGALRSWYVGDVDGQLELCRDAPTPEEVQAGWWPHVHALCPPNASCRVGFLPALLVTPDSGRFSRAPSGWFHLSPHPSA
jgi:hypothetical protein